MKNKRGQAALEFLMTYGWAILVVLAAIGALAYFGVLSPDRFLPEKCTLPSGVACLDFTYDAAANSFTLVIQNSQGFDAQNVSVSVNGTGCVASDNTTTSQADGAKNNFVFDCGGTTLPSGKFKGVVSYVFTNGQTLLTHTKEGELIAKIP